MIDTHCHILPNIDDGPQSMDESIAMARLAYTDGIQKIIATPHITDKQYSREEISQRVDALNHALKQEDIPVRVYPGAEVAISMDPEKISKYTLNHSSYILIEFPHNHLPGYAQNLLNWLCAQNLKPIIAHPERNYSIIRSPEALLNFLTPNIHIQITAGSLTGDFGRDIQYCAQFLLNSGKVDIIASDAHSKTIRPPRLSAARKMATKYLNEENASSLFCTNPAAILNDQKFDCD